MISVDKLSKISVFILCSLIVLVTSLCLMMFHDSPAYLSLLAMLFIFSAVKAVVSSSIEHQKGRLSDQIVNKFFRKSGAKNDRVAGKGDIKPNHLCPDPVVDVGLTTIPSVAPPLPLGRYLEINNFILNDEIMAAIEWKRFELLCHLIFRATGYNSRLTGNGADEGVDIRIYDKENSSQVLYLVQCKKWNKKSKIDRPLIQQLLGQMAAENVTKGGYCVTSYFTKPAIDFASSNNIELFDQQKIILAFNRLEMPIRAKILKQLLEGDYWTPSCATCGHKFRVAKTKSGKMVWACKGSKGSKGHGWSSISYFEAAPIAGVGE